MEMIKLDITKATKFLKAGAVEGLEPKVKAAQEALESGSCEGSDFLGWLHLPTNTSDKFLDEVQACLLYTSEISARLSHSVPPNGWK